VELLNLNWTSSLVWSLNQVCSGSEPDLHINTKPMGTRRWVWVRVTPGSDYVDPCKNPYPQSGYGFLAGTGTGTSESTQGLPMHFTSTDLHSN